MQKIKVFIISGKKGTGKDTLANSLKQHLRGQTETIMFAGALKQMAEILTGIKMVNGDYTQAQKLLPTKFGHDLSPLMLRDILQILGTEGIRNTIDLDAWVKIAVRKIEESTANNIIITDCRFPNELLIDNYLSSDKYEVVKIRIERDNIPIDNHSSETALDDVVPEVWQFLIKNNGTLNEFISNVSKIISS